MTQRPRPGRVPVLGTWLPGRRARPDRAPRRAASALVVAAAMTLGAACGDGAADEARPLTVDEAGDLARTLVVNHDAGGARFRVELTVEGAPVVFDGSVDWVLHAGSGEVQVGEAPPYQVRWTEDAVLQALPGLAERTGGASWVVRPGDPARYRLDTLIAVVTGLANETPDNPVNLRQQADVVFVRDDEIDGVEVAVVRKGDVGFWIDDDATLHRLDAPIRFADDGVATMAFTDRGPVEVELPSRGDAVDQDDIPGIYAELTRVGVL